MSLSAAIELLALVGYPDSIKGRARAVKAMEAYWLRACKAYGTADRLGPVLTTQSMENQLRQLTRRLNQRIKAASDCVSLDMDLTLPDGKRASLNDVALDRAATGDTERYKSDWWHPEVMHLAIVLRGVMIEWNNQSREFDIGNLLLNWPLWIRSAVTNSTHIAAELRNHSNPALKGFRGTKFLFPSSSLADS